MDKAEKPIEMWSELPQWLGFGSIEALKHWIDRESSRATLRRRHDGIESQEVASEAIYKLLLACHKDPFRKPVEQPEHYLKAVVRNVAIDLQRKDARFSTMSEVTQDIVDQENSKEEEHLVQKRLQLDELFMELISKCWLTVDEEQLLTKHFVEGKSFNEIAKELSKDPLKIANDLNKIKARLRYRAKSLVGGQNENNESLAISNLKNGPHVYGSGNSITWAKSPVGAGLRSNNREQKQKRSGNISAAVENKPLLSQDTSSSPFNGKYTFSSFVVASCNRFAHAAAQAVVEAPGRTYNPLYLYGNVGLGKTHLIQATGQAIKRANPKLKVAYLSLERFMNQLLDAIRYGYDKTSAFRERYRSVDVLLIDDVQFIAGKERTQEELFHTFNALYDTYKQIVITSDCPPREIPDLEERLHSRFEWGLIADIEPPDLETKVAILRRKAELQKVDLPDDVAIFLAGNSKHNIRELEGSFIRVLAMASLRGVAVSKALAQEAMRNTLYTREGSPISILSVQQAVANYYKISLDSLRSGPNMREVLVPRQIAMYLCKRLTKKSYPEIARQFGGKHHTTVIHSVEKISHLIDSDREMNTVVNHVISSIEA